jgi:hypothetical protein
MTGGAVGPATAPSVRRRWQVWLLAVAVLLEIAAGAFGVRATGRPATMIADLAAPSVAGARPAPPDLGAVADRTAEVQGLLDARAAALLHRDRAGWLAGLDPRAAAFRARQAAVFDALAAVPLRGWQYRVDAQPERSLTAAALRRYRLPVWVPSVTLRYALAGVDTEPTERPMVFTFVQRGGRWYLATDSDATADGVRTWRGVWDFGRVVVRRGRSSLVLAHPDRAALLSTFAVAVDDAVPAVSAVWGTAWSRRVALLLPDSQAEMAALVGEQFALGAIAAVAIADYADARSGVVRGQRVVINPANLARLNALSRRIVLRHEITHIASRAVTSDAMPTWLIEGFADYVGYLGTGLPATLVARDLRGEIRAGTWPGTLPADRGFRSDAPNLAAAYEEGWTACRFIAARAGTAGLVRLYRLVGKNGPEGETAAVDGALRQVLHMTYAAFLAQWRRSVRTDLG